MMCKYHQHVVGLTSSSGGGAEREEQEEVLAMKAKLQENYGQETKVRPDLLSPGSHQTHRVPAPPSSSSSSSYTTSSSSSCRPGPGSSARMGREEGVTGGRYSSSSEELLLDPLDGGDEETVSSTHNSYAYSSCIRILQDSLLLPFYAEHNDDKT